MILYKHQYDKLSADHISVGTKNTSFLKTYHVLRKMGIQNNKFHLYLHQPELAKYDPHNLTDPSIELRMKIAYECKINVWYYIREVIRIPVTGTTGGVQFILNRANLNLIWLYFNNVDNLLIMPRQIGKTMGTISIDSYLIYIRGTNIVKTMLTKSDKLRKENVSRLKEIRDLLPDYLVHKTSKDINNMDEVSYDRLSNKYITFVSQSSKSGAESMGRGLTTPSQHWDEIAFFDNAPISYPAALNATLAAVENAKKFGQNYSNILTTTAGRLDTDSGKFVYNLLCKALTFTEHFYDVQDNDALNRILENNSPIGMFYSEYSYEQLGKTEEWFKRASSRSGGDEDQVKMDFLNIWVYGTESAAIDSALLEQVIASKKEVKFSQIKDGFVIKWYIDEKIVKSPEFKKIPIVIGSDSSENIGKDFTSFIFLDARSLEVIGTCRCNTSNIITVALFMYKFVKLPNVLFAPERNHVGSAMIDAMLLEMEKDGVNPFFRIYNEVVQNLSKDDKFKNVNLHTGYAVNKFRKYFGFRTTSSSTRGRTFLYKTVFFKALEMGGSKINDSDLISEIAGLSISSKGRIDHADGQHDDMVIGYIMACYSLFFGENLNKYDFCNHDASVILSRIRTNTSSNGQIEVTIDEDRLRRKLIALKRKLSRTTNDTLKLQYGAQIEQLVRVLPDETDVFKDIPSMEKLKTEENEVISPVERYNEASSCITRLFDAIT